MSEYRVKLVVNPLPANIADHKALEKPRSAEIAAQILKPVWERDCKLITASWLELAKWVRYKQWNHSYSQTA